MAEFHFDNNIGDVVCFRFQNDEGTCGGQQRGIVRTIIVGKDKFGYTIETPNGTDYVESKDVVRTVYSTKSFDVMHPGIEVYYHFAGLHQQPIQCVVDSAFIEKGRLFYIVRDCDMNSYIAAEGLVKMIDSNEYNLQYFD